MPEVGNFSALSALPNTYRAFYASFSYLNTIQKQTIKPILNADDLILQSPTGSGKTEAIMAPALERLIQEKNKLAQQPSSFRIIYIVPTKALAIDLKRRLQPIIMGKLGLFMAVRTGDIKQKGGERPDFIITTPESFDVMLGSKKKSLCNFVRQIGIVIIDEAHSLIFNYRGEQLKAVLHRLDCKMRNSQQGFNQPPIKNPVQKIALSATIGNLDGIASFFNFSDHYVKIRTTSQRKIIPHLTALQQIDEVANLLVDLRQHWHYKKILVFVNSRGRCDEILSYLQSLDAFNGQVKLHYSNLKTAERHAVETWFRSQKQAICIATSTLELGIDIGDVDSVVLFQPPDTVAGFLQRIGRANRKQNNVHFWGVCYGADAEHQLLRFLALLSLSNSHKMELQQPKKLHSVYLQQILSCLYEKEQLSLESLQLLFCDQKNLIADIFQHISKNGWLKESKIKKLYTGAKRYYDYRFDYKIWSNFPETGEEYVLECEKQSIADIPTILVKQLNVGDKVLLAGKHVQITKIDTVPYKRLEVIVNQQQQDNKQIFWIGKGSLVSYDVAQEIKRILEKKRVNKQQGKQEGILKGLFKRPSKLFHQAHQRYHSSVTLENKVVVTRTANGLFRYWTFLGGVGNLILQYSIEAYQQAQFVEQEGESGVGGISCSADDTAIECSQFINFQQLKLPTTEQQFHAWCQQYQSLIVSMVALNNFARFLPPKHLLEEIASFFYDPRLLIHFSEYQQLSSDILHGDLQFFNQQYIAQDPEIEKIIPVLSTKEKLLDVEKQKYIDSAWKALPIKKGVTENKTDSITGTLLANYIRHQQCNRWLKFKLSPDLICPPDIKCLHPEHDLLLQKGIQHEKNSIELLRNKGHIIVSVESENRTLDQRFEETCRQLIEISTRLSQQSQSKEYILEQAVLIDPLLTGASAIKAIGIPDIIRITRQQTEKPENNILGTKTIINWEVGDIKNSHKAHYYQKWQVAFYVNLLTQLKNKWQDDSLTFTIKIVMQGVLITHSLMGEKSKLQANAHPIDKKEPELCFFDLSPYFSSFNTLLKKINKVIHNQLSPEDFQLNAHCNSCGWFGYCYQQALTEDIFLYSHISRGLLQKFKRLNIKTLKQAQLFFDRQSNPSESLEKSQRELLMFDKIQIEQIKQQLDSLESHVFLLKSVSTRLFPQNISSFILIHSRLDKQAFSNGLGSFCWQVMETSGELKESSCWPQNNKTLNESFEQLWLVWCGLIKHNSGPHIFYFGQQEWTLFIDASSDLNKEPAINYLWQNHQKYCTDLRQLLKSHFYLPIPGLLTLKSIDYLLDKTVSRGGSHFFDLDPQPPQTAFASFKSYANIYTQLVSQLRSEVRQSEWKNNLSHTAIIDIFNHFIQQEKDLNDIELFDMQKQPLEHRIAKYRAIAPIFFKSTQLDDEGHFLYKFSMPVILSKFRRGDFLKLVVTGQKQGVGFDSLQQDMAVILVATTVSITDDSGELLLQSRTGKLSLNHHSAYSLEEDLSDFNTEKLIHVNEQIFNSSHRYPATDLLVNSKPASPLLANHSSTELDDVNAWVVKHQSMMKLNSKQQDALCLPFKSPVSLIEGPPGTGKTYLLGWIIIALFTQAQKQGRPLRILVSALTHQAIDNVLNKVVSLLNSYYGESFPLVCAKWGRFSACSLTDPKVNFPKQVIEIKDKSDLTSSSYLLLGATGFGCYQLFKGKKKKERGQKFPDFFDYVVIDEASQLLIPQALLSLIYAKGNFIFLGDTQQLPPIIKGKYKNDRVKQSILAYLTSLYDSSQQVMLDTSYRMNQEICQFPGDYFYQQKLRTVQTKRRLNLNNFSINDEIDSIINPESPVRLLLLKHQGYHQQSPREVNIIVEIVYRLMVDYLLKAEDIAIIAPHRAQNNAITFALQQHLKIPLEKLPLVDTVERVQGAEREIIIFSLTSSDLDVIENDFLNNRNRFNVAITRAKNKLIIIASEQFFNNISHHETALQHSQCFKDFLNFCSERQLINVLE